MCTSYIPQFAGGCENRTATDIPIEKCFVCDPFKSFPFLFHVFVLKLLANSSSEFRWTYNFDSSNVLNFVYMTDIKYKINYSLRIHLFYNYFVMLCSGLIMVCNELFMSRLLTIPAQPKHFCFL